MSLNTPTLRSARPADIPALHALDCLCFDPPFRFSLRTMRHFASAAGAIVYLAETPDARTGFSSQPVQAPVLAGFVLLNLTRGPASSAYVTTLDVHPAHRRAGLASTLMSSGHSAARIAGVTAIHLHVHTANTPAIDFYERIGYTRTVFAPSFYAPTLDAWLYTYPLQSGG